MAKPPPKSNGDAMTETLTHPSETFGLKFFGCIVQLKDGEEMPDLNPEWFDVVRESGNTNRVKINDLGTYWGNGMYFPYRPKNEAYQILTLDELLDRVPADMIPGGRHVHTTDLESMFPEGL